MNNKFCRYCGTQNNYDYIYCKKCGKLLDAESDIANNPNVSDAADLNQPNPSVNESNNAPYPNDYQNGNSNPYNAPYGTPNSNPYNAPYGTPNAPNVNPQYTPIPDSIDGVNTEDVAIFLGKDSPKYLPIFAGIETKTRSSFNLFVLLLSALVSPFFAAFWFMHKRMNKLGLFIFLILAAFEFGILIAVNPYS